MKTKLLLLLAMTAPSAFAAEYLHLRNERVTATVYLIKGIPGIQQVSLHPNESITFRFATDKTKISIGGSSSREGKVVVVEANKSPEIGMSVQDDFSSYPILNRVVNTTANGEMVNVEEKK